MIQSFRHKGLRLFYEQDDPSKLQPHHIEKIRRILYKLDEAVAVEDMDVIGWQLHPLRGKEEGEWSVKVNGNWRITFRIDDGNAYDINYQDYH